MILVGVDFSEGARAALSQGRALAKAMGMSLGAIHVLEYGEPTDWKPAPEQTTWMSEAGIGASDVMLRRGVPWVELVRYARERDVALLVAGRHGTTGPQPMALGTTALRVATHASSPVLLVSRDTQRGASTLVDPH